MNAELLLDHFNRISDAPDALRQLRRFVLDLAVRGKLVDQDPSDESASSLVQRIRREKLRVIERGDERKEKPFLPLGADECPFPLPCGWSWSQLAEIGFLNPRNAAANETPASFVPMSMISAEYGVANADEVRPWGEIKAGFTHFADGDVGLAKITPCFENRKSTVFRNLRSGIGAGTTELHVIRPVFVSEDFVLIFLKSPYFIESGIPRMTGTAGQKRLPTEHFAYSPFPLPPLTEQRRIVCKVDELMALCDRLEAAQRERNSRRDLLVASAHHHINNGVDAEALRSHAQFFIGQLPRLTSHPNHIERLRHTIFGLAVRGRLVVQDASDEPASQLLKRVLADKARLSKAGQMKKDKQLWDGLPKEPPYDVPRTWTWAHLQDIFEISRGGSPRPAGDPQFFGGPIPWITVREITKDGGKYLTSTESGLTEEGALRSRFVEPYDLLLTNSGATLGVPKITLIKGCMNDGVAVLRKFHAESINEFAYLYLKSQTGAFRQINQGMGQPNLNTSIIAGWFFPLPPLPEQERIVTKVSELMLLCDQLEVQLTTTQVEASHLLESVLHNALDGPTEPQLSHSSA